MFLCIVSRSDSHEPNNCWVLDRPRDPTVRGSVARFPSCGASAHSHLAMPDDTGTHKSIYFAYGSNLWIDQMNRRCPEHKYIGIGILHNW
jgi:hypothetical protein